MPERDPLVSVVIPVLNDTPELTRALTSIVHDPRLEVIVVDGGDGEAETTLGAAAPHVTWLRSSPGRGRQMNEGAKAARGQWILLLLADTRLPSGWIEEIERGAARFLRRRQLPASARLTEPMGAAHRAGSGDTGRWFDLPYGDQALVVRRDVFSAIARVLCHSSCQRSHEAVQSASARDRSGRRGHRAGGPR